jgi:hypothetical protein
MQKLNIQNYPLIHKWDFRTGSPHRVFRAIHDVAEELGYAMQITEPLELKGLPIADTATFKAEVKGETQISVRYSEGQAAGGILCIIVGVALFFAGWGADLVLLFAGVGLCIFGIILVATAEEKRKRVLLVRMEGEAYKASAKIVDWAEATDIVADVRVVVSVSIVSFAGGAEIKEEKVKDADRRMLEEDFGKLLKRVETVLPSFIVRDSFCEPSSPKN